MAGHTDSRLFVEAYRSRDSLVKRGAHTLPVLIRLPIRPALAETLKQCDFTSVQRRIQSIHELSPGELGNKRGCRQVCSRVQFNWFAVRDEDRVT